MIRQEIESAEVALAAAESYFDSVTEPVEVDIATWQLSAAKMRLNAAYAKAKVQVKGHAKDRMAVLSVKRKTSDGNECAGGSAYP